MCNKEQIENIILYYADCEEVILIKSDNAYNILTTFKFSNCEEDFNKLLDKAYEKVKEQEAIEFNFNFDREAVAV